MSGPLVSAAGAFVAQNRKPYQIQQSLRFRGAQKLQRSVGTTGDRRNWTASVWFKGIKGTGVFLESFSDSSTWSVIAIAGTGALLAQNRVSATTVGPNSANNNIYFRDPSAWYHLVVNQNGSTNDCTIYINGASVLSVSVTTNWLFNTSGQAMAVGARTINDEYFENYMAEYHFIDGTVLTPSSFGKTDTITGAWIPKKYSGSYGTNGFYLKFDPSATNGIGHDHSGNGNNFTPSGFSTSGTGTDVMSDTPTNNFCTLNPLDKNSSQVPKDGNLYFDGSVATGGLDVIAGTMRVTSGKWYWESTITNVGSIAVAGVGITKIQCAGRSVGGSLGGVSGECAYLPSGNKQLDGSSSAYGASFTTGDVIGVALDCDAGTVTFYKNNTSQGSISYAVGNGLAPAIGQVQGYGAIQTLNFGQRAFAYTPPTGYKALSTGNLPEPTIKKGGAHFNTVLWTGDGTSSHAITGVGFQPDWVWLKSRSLAQAGNLIDAVRGVDKYLRSSSTAAEATFSFLSSFDTDGFTLGTSDAGANQSSATYVGWNWKANGAGSSNTAGSITSTVSANATAGFSIATYSANNTAGATFGHGLGVALSMVIIKKRNASERWVVYHKSISNQYIYLNETFAGETANAALRFGNDSSVVAPSSTLVTIGTSNDVNGASGTYVAYCFSEVAGYSKFGSYTGNGSSDGPFVACNFRPRWIMVKRTDASNSWVIMDTSRSTYNYADSILWADLPDSQGAGGTTTSLDVLSNGFKLRGSGGSINASGGTYIFAAFSETAFKFANAR